MCRELVFFCQVVLILCLLVAVGAYTTRGEGAEGLIERPDSTRNPHVTEPPTGVGAGLAYELPVPVPLDCGIIRETPDSDLMGDPWLNSQRYVQSDYDANHDGAVDAILLTVPGTVLPRFYIFDTNFDGYVDVQFKDTRLNGTCEGIELDWWQGMPEDPTGRIPGSGCEDGQCDSDPQGET